MDDRDKRMYKSPNSGLYLYKKLMHPFQKYINTGKTKTQRAGRELVILDLYTDILDGKIKVNRKKRKKKKSKKKN